MKGKRKGRTRSTASPSSRRRVRDGGEAVPPNLREEAPPYRVNGGGTRAQAIRTIPENANSYPEPSMFGDTPSYGFYMRHVDGIEMNDIDVRFLAEDQRPAFALTDVKDADFNNIKAQGAADVPTFVLRNVEQFTLRDSRDLPDKELKQANEESF